jgi:hypothetical protein
VPAGGFIDLITLRSDPQSLGNRLSMTKASQGAIIRYRQSGVVCRDVIVTGSSIAL